MYFIRFPILYIVFQIKNGLRTLKASFGLKNKNMKPSKKNDVLIKKKCILQVAIFIPLEGFRKK